jgi:hypothetical protein
MAESNRKCSECGNTHAATRGDCEPLEKRRGPAITDPKHPSNDGSWARVLASLTGANVGKEFGPFFGGASAPAVKAPPRR